MDRKTKAVLAVGVCLSVIELLRRSRKKACPKVRFRLFYWPMAGRGEFIRLLFAETNTPYEDPYSKMTWPEAQKVCYNNPEHFAVPALEDRSLLASATDKSRPLVFSQTPVIIQHLATHCDGGRLMPRQEALKIKAAALNHDVADLAAESCNAWHAVHPNKSWTEQKEGTQHAVDFFLKERVPKWLAHFGRALQRNVQACGLDPSCDVDVYFVGNSLTYADLMVCNMMNGLRCGTSPLGQSALRYEALASPLLKKFVLQILARPRVKAWYHSEDRHDYGAGSPGF